MQEPSLSQHGNSLYTLWRRKGMLWWLWWGWIILQQSSKGTYDYALRLTLKSLFRNCCGTLWVPWPMPTPLNLSFPWTLPMPTRSLTWLSSPRSPPTPPPCPLSSRPPLAVSPLPMLDSTLPTLESASTMSVSRSPAAFNENLQSAGSSPALD